LRDSTATEQVAVERQRVPLESVADLSHHPPRNVVLALHLRRGLVERAQRVLRSDHVANRALRAT
jgi:hypothetical protein